MNITRLPGDRERCGFGEKVCITHRCEISGCKGPAHWFVQSSGYSSHGWHACAEHAMAAIRHSHRVLGLEDDEPVDVVDGELVRT